MASTWRHGLTAEAGADWQLMFALLLAGLSRLGCLFRDEVFTGPLMRCHVQRLVDFRLGAEQGCSSFVGDHRIHLPVHTTINPVQRQSRSSTSLAGKKASDQMLSCNSPCLSQGGYAEEGRTFFLLTKGCAILSRMTAKENPRDRQAGLALHTIMPTALQARKHY